jgi:ABC-type transport system substrate-binding protein
MSHNFFRLFAAAWLFSTALGAYAQASQAAEPGQPPKKTLKYAFEVAETGFDPANISDLYSRIVAASVFESLYTWDFLARPAKIVPALAEADPEISPDFQTFTFKMKKGVVFPPHPAFGGKPREVTADDLIYSFKRHYDPANKSYAYTGLETLKVLGLNELRAKAIKNKTPFEYDTAVEGVQALDRYTVRFRLAVPTPRFQGTFTDPSLFGVVAREIIEQVGKPMENPWGTGPFRLVKEEWRRSSRIVLERNASFRELVFDGTPAADDAAAQAILQQHKGKRLPMVDRVEISIIEEDQPRWLAFLNAEHDFLERLPNNFANIAIPNNQLAPNLAKQGIQMARVPLPDMTVTYFNFEDPVVGGNDPARVALRRAVALAYDSLEEIRLVRRNQAIPAHAPIAPLTTGWTKDFRSEMGTFDRARAKALLDMYGYVDKDGDGWRDLPDGKPFTLMYATQPDQRSRQLNELWKKNMSAVGLRMEFQIAKWPDQLKQARAGKLQMWGLGFSATGPDPDTFFQGLYGPAKGENNLSRFDMKAYNEMYEKQKTLPDGPERLALLNEMRKIMIAYMPYKAGTHRIATDMWHPWVKGYMRHPFLRHWFTYVDIEPAAQKASQ